MELWGYASTEPKTDVFLCFDLTISTPLLQKSRNSTDRSNNRGKISNLRLHFCGYRNKLLKKNSLFSPISFRVKKETMKLNYIGWEKKQIEWWKKKLGVSDHGIAWISFVKGIVIGLAIYHFFIDK